MSRVRCGIIVQNTSHILEVLSWFQDPDCGLEVVKIKNRYSAKADIIDGYRDVRLVQSISRCKSVSSDSPLLPF